jgi:hypothetical protein
VPGTRFRVPGNPNPGHFYPASCIPGVRVFQRQVPGTGYRIRWPAFGPRPGQRRREGRTSLAPQPSMAEGRIPSPEDRTTPATCMVRERRDKISVRKDGHHSGLPTLYPPGQPEGVPFPRDPLRFLFFQGLGRSGADAGGFSPDGDPVVRAEVTGAGLGSGRPGVPGGPRWDRGSW